jgi:Spy/CpxP family protein refolding chaperone
MRKTTILAAGAALLLATAASAQQQPAPAPAEPATPQAPSAEPKIQSISIVDIEQLPEATKAQVNEIVAKRSEADLQKLRGSIDATPQVKSALEAQGLTSAEVIAASLDEKGALTLITKKKTG